MFGILSKILLVVKFLPGLVAGAQSLFGKGEGVRKKGYVADAVEAIMGTVEEFAGKDILDEKAFAEGLEMVQEGVVMVMKASVLYERK